MDKKDVPTLIATLNEWEQKYGPLGGGRGLASTGEAPAQIAELKARLRALGVTVEWNGHEYVIAGRPGGNAPKDATP